jgi:hypothetical protein
MPRRRDNEAPEMRRRAIQVQQPRAREDVELIRAGRDGIWWQARDGLRIQLAAPEQQSAAAQRSRLSVLAVLLAMIAGGRTRV